MNKSKRVVKNILFIFIVVILVIGGYFLYTKLTGKENVFNNIIDKKEEKSETDNYNGVYVYSEKLDRSYSVYGGCTVNSLDQYIVVIDDEYYLYDYTCMGTYEKGSGKVSELDFSLADNNLYKLKYDDKTFDKNINISYVIPGSNIKSKIKSINPDTYKFVLKNSEFEGNYFDLEKIKIYGASNYSMSLIHDSGEHFFMTINGSDPTLSGKTSQTMSLDIRNLDYLPDFVSVYSKLAIISKDVNSDNLYNYNLVLFDNLKGDMFNLKSLFPITINDKELNYSNNSIYLNYSKLNRSFNLLIGYNNEFCSTDSDSNEVTYYLFKIDYDLENQSLKRPEYVKTYYKKDGCDDYNKMIGV